MTIKENGRRMGQISINLHKSNSVESNTILKKLL